MRLAKVLNSTLTVERVSYIREELKGNQKGTYESERGAKGRESVLSSWHLEARAMSRFVTFGNTLTDVRRVERAIMCAVSKQQEQKQKTVSRSRDSMLNFFGLR